MDRSRANFEFYHMDIKVAIFEDNKLVRDALQSILNSTPGYACVGVYDNGRHWQQELERCNADVVLMDIEMPGIDGITLTRLITSVFHSVKILIQTVFDDKDKIFNALCAGASGYILKTDPPGKYLEAIRDIHQGGSFMNAAVAKKTLAFFTNKNVILISPQNKDYQLSEREREILLMLVDGQALKVIAEKLFISHETVRTHVKHIYKKLHVASRSEAVMKAIQHGIS